MSACGGSREARHQTVTTPPPTGAQTVPVPTTTTPTTPQAAPSAPTRPALGITEDNANLLWSPAGPHQPPAGFRQAQQDLTALHPAYIRLLVDWAVLQPAADQPANLQEAVSGCARLVGPCGPYAGLREELAAIASQQRAGGGFRVVLNIYGVPAWAARPPAGCEASDATSFSRALRPSALADYRALIRALAVLGEQEGVALQWWAAWNEPNNAEFVSPQRSACSSSSPSLSPAVYAQLARAMHQELEQLGGARHMLLGELGGYTSNSPWRTSIASFVAALPANVICMSDVWSVHAYVARDRAHPPDPVAALERALDARGRCGRDASIWITETGAGAPDPGAPLHPEAGGEQAACQTLAASLIRWYGDPRIATILQYTFREDSDYPVGLISADLAHLFPTYYLWLAWSQALQARGSPPALPVQCAS